MTKPTQCTTAEQQYLKECIKQRNREETANPHIDDGLNNTLNNFTTSQYCD